MCHGTGIYVGIYEESMLGIHAGIYAVIYAGHVPWYRRCTIALTSEEALTSERISAKTLVLKFNYIILIDKRHLIAHFSAFLPRRTVFMKIK